MEPYILDGERKIPLWIAGILTPDARHYLAENRKSTYALLIDKFGLMEEELYHNMNMGDMDDFYASMSGIHDLIESCMRRILWIDGVVDGRPIDAFGMSLDLVVAVSQPEVAEGYNAFIGYLERMKENNKKRYQ